VNIRKKAFQLCCKGIIICILRPPSRQHDKAKPTD